MRGRHELARIYERAKLLVIAAARLRSRNAAGAFDLASLAPVLWLKFNELALANDALIASVPNAGSGGSAATQGGIDNFKPVFKTAVKNGLGVGRFDGLNDFLTGTLSSATYGGNTSKTLALVLDAKNAAGDVFFNYGFEADSKSFGVSHTSGSKLSIYQWGPGRDISSAASTTGWQMITAVKNGSSLSLYRDTTLIDGPTSVTAASVDDDTYDIGRLIDGVFGGEYASMDLGELVLVPVACDATQLGNMWTSLKTKWAV